MLAAIYNVWDGEELLVGSMRSIKDCVDLFIIVWQDESNFGGIHNPMNNLSVEEMNSEFNIHWCKYLPRKVGRFDEVEKRNMGIEIAKGHGCTHFILMDCDEYYLPNDFRIGVDAFKKSHKDGSVVRLYTYFGDATLRQEMLDNYYVPFIHRLHHDTRAGKDTYPFYVDPTRRINTKDVIEIPVIMQHYSWVRRNILRKAANSSARDNIAKSSLLREYSIAREGLKVNGGNLLIKVPDYFGINEMISNI